MRVPSYSLVALILCSAVLCAAELGHSVVVSLARHGLIAGPYLTYKHETVLPALLAALILCLVVAVSLFGDALSRAAGLRCDWLADAAVRVGRISFFSLLPLIFASQILLLFLFETAEQILAFGHPLGLSATMGAPMLVALAVHATATFAVSLFLVFFCRSIVLATQEFARTAGSYIRQLLIAEATQPTIPRTPLFMQSGCKLIPLLAQHLANRPPPSAIPIA